MLVPILKHKQATAENFAIIETFAKVRYLKCELKDLHQESDKCKQMSKMGTLRGRCTSLAERLTADLRAASENERLSDPKIRKSALAEKGDIL